MGAEHGVQTYPHAAAHLRCATVMLDGWATLAVTQLRGTGPACHLVALHTVYMELLWCSKVFCRLVCIRANLLISISDFLMCAQAVSRTPTSPIRSDMYGI